MGETNCLGRRVVAFLIDWMIIGYIAGAMAALGILEIKVVDGGIPNALWFYLIVLVYYLSFVFINRGRTAGKMLLQLEISTPELGFVYKYKLALREIVKVVLLPVSILSLGLSLTNMEHRSFHDIISGTTVVIKY